MKTFRQFLEGIETARITRPSSAHTRDVKFSVERLKTARYKRIGVMGKVTLFMTDDPRRRYLVALDLSDKDEYGYMPAMFFAEMYKISIPGISKVTHRISYVEADVQYKGFNLAPKMYGLYLNSVSNSVLVADSSQSAGGRNLWNELADTEFVDVFVYSKQTKKMHRCEKSDNGKVECEIDMYSNTINRDWNNPDYFLCASKKGLFKDIEDYEAHDVPEK